VSDYGLDGRGSIPDRGRGYSSNLSVQTGSGAHLASCTMGTGGPFPGVKRGRGVMLTAHPLLVPRLRKSRSYTSSHTKRLHGVWRDHFTFTFYVQSNKQLSLSQLMHGIYLGSAAFPFQALERRAAQGMFNRLCRTA
jgi:hypothetical protein